MITSLLLAIILPIASIAAEPTRVVATFSILADITRAIAGDSAKVESLVGLDADVHAFEPSPADLKTISQSQLIITNGLGLDTWIIRLHPSPTTTVGVSVTTQKSPPQGVSVTASDGANLRPGDPHCWQDPMCGSQYAENIARALAAANPDKATEIRERAESYRKQIQEIEERYKKAFGAIPKNQKRILTSHDSLGYFARAYGIEVFRLKGTSTTSDSSAAELARVANLIKEKKITAAFFENSNDDRGVKQLAKDYGLRIGGVLYTDSLSKNPEASTYLKMLETNAARVLEQLRGSH